MKTAHKYQIHLKQDALSKANFFFFNTLLQNECLGSLGQGQNGELIEKNEPYKKEAVRENKKLKAIKNLNSNCTI